MSEETRLIVKLGYPEPKVLHYARYPTHAIRIEGGYLDHTSGTYVFEGVQINYGVAHSKLNEEITALSVNDRHGNMVGRVVLVPTKGDAR